MSRLLRCLILVLLVTTPIRAMPLFNYDGALNWGDQSVKSDIPKEDRIYIFGPDKVTETYLLDNKPTQHDVEVRRVVRYDPAMTLASVLRTIPRDKNRKVWVNVYRPGGESWKPAISIEIDDLSRLVMIDMHPRDVVRINYVPPPGGPPTPTA